MTRHSLATTIAPPAATLVLLLACTALTACGSSSYSAGTTTAQSQPAQAVHAKSAASTPAITPMPASAGPATQSGSEKAAPEGGDTHANASATHLFARFSLCMQQQGVSLPQSGESERSSSLATSLLTSRDPRVKAARAKCVHFLAR
jgi:hypothetical protein